MFPLMGQAQEQRSYQATIWIDPDGCEHWVMDLGIEGMMSPILDREGRPQCGRSKNICMEFPGDMLFASGSAYVSAESINILQAYFIQAMTNGAKQFTIAGHTDNVGTEMYNFDLSRNRAEAVASVARQVGAVVTANAFGELEPIDTNETDYGRQRNRRVEVYCDVGSI